MDTVRSLRDGTNSDKICTTYLLT